VANLAWRQGFADSRGGLKVDAAALMRELAAMRMPAMLAAIAMVAGLLWSAPGVAQGSATQDNATRDTVAAARDSRAQSRVRRVRPRIRVQPLYPYRRYFSLYPLPYDVEYPGPHARRDCAVRYVSEYRPSGTVVVPRMNCWWVRG
jgi:hypothetical protein